MEGKKPHNEDDKLNSGSEVNKNEESDDFGLPEAPSDDQTEEKGEEPEIHSFSTGDTSESEDKPAGVETSAPDASSYREENKSPIGLIITLIIIGVVAIVVATYFLFLKKPKEEPVVIEEKPVIEAVDSTLLETPIEEPVVEPVIEEPVVGEFQTLTEKTGRYYVVIASFVDSDLAADYAKKLSQDGVSSTILSPEGKGFHRLAIGVFDGFRDANMRVDEVKENYGSEIWVLKY